MVKLKNKIITINTIKKTTSEDELAKIVEELKPTLIHQLKALSKTLQKFDYATTDNNNNHGQYSDLNA